MSLVIMSGSTGRLGNQLFLFAHFIANATEYGYTIINPSFYRFAPFFIGSHNNYLSQYPPRQITLKGHYLLAPPLHRLCNYHARLCSKYNLARLLFPVIDISRSLDRRNEAYNLSSASFHNIRRQSVIASVYGYMFRDFESFTKHHNTVRAYFQPIPSIFANTAQIVNNAKRGNEILIGVHIRQTDYRTWEHGRYFYDTSVYASVMRHCLELWPHKRIAFLICSDEPQDVAYFKGLRVHVGVGELIEDLYSMASCDYLIGTQSTYSQWASFYGNVPRYVLPDNECRPLRQLFNVATG
jgi:hypothetical protein